MRLRRRLQRALHGSEASIISSNCIGSRISALAGNPYRSPTVGLFIDPESFLELVPDLPRYLTHQLSEDAEATERRGFPVGRMGPVTLNFQHYWTFADAEEHWRERAQRVDVDNVVLLCTDRNGMSPDRIARFSALPMPRKVILTAKPYPSTKTYTGVFALQDDYAIALAKFGGGSAADRRRPVIVTGADFGKGLVVGCPWCSKESPFDQKWRGEDIKCPRCQGPLRVNKFVVGESMFEVK